MHYKIKELHRLITTLKNEDGLSDYGVTLLEGYAVGLETVVNNCSIPAVINWAYFSENKPSYGDQILIQDPPEQMTTPRVEVYDRTTEWIDGSRYAVITPCL